MQSLCRYIAPPSPCGYLPAQQWSLEYEYFLDLTAEQYQERMKQGWRRFGSMVFRPRCRHCNACRSLRVPVDAFTPHRNQRRAAKLNDADVRLVIGPPEATRAKLRLYDRYHTFQSGSKGWPHHPAKDFASYRDSFVHNPFPTEEWNYLLGDLLIGIGYVDVLPESLSAIYFFYDPDHRHRSLGVYNVLSVLREARRRRLPHVYLGYFVEGCRSLEYKATFRPNEILGSDGVWRAFRT
jgi:arginine-tRNA-protein transferase